MDDDAIKECLRPLCRELPSRPGFVYADAVAVINAYPDPEVLRAVGAWVHRNGGCFHGEPPKESAGLGRRVDGQGVPQTARFEFPASALED